MAQKQGSCPKIGRAKRPGEKKRRERYHSVYGPTHKIRNIILHNGKKWAEEWAQKHGHLSLMLKYIRESKSTHVKNRW